MIIATAGHIDHGKTALVKALTGIDTDRLPEEKKRGMSIDLGFAYHPLPSGRVLGFVDVPGHEKFIRNMLAGVIGVDYALLVVAADDGPMPQTREHLDILDLLNVSDGVAVLTKIDRIDGAKTKKLELELKNFLSNTCLKGIDIMPVSVVDGTGVTALREHLEAMTDLVEDRVSGGYFRLAIDRCFTVQGVGLVLTGTVFSGTVKNGDQLILSPEGIEVRVRGIHSQNKESQIGSVGQRCAINITGTDLKRFGNKRGGWLLESSVHQPVARFDGILKVLGSEKRSLRHWTPVHVHAGATRVLGRVAMLDGTEILPGQAGLVQIVLDRRIGILKDDNFILRDQNARRTIAGGAVLDPFAPARGRSKEHRITYLRDMKNTSVQGALKALTNHNPQGVDLDLFSMAWNLKNDDVTIVLEALKNYLVGPKSSRFIFSPKHWEAWQNMTIVNLENWHKSNPDRSSIDARGLRTFSTVRLGLEVFEGLLNELAVEKKILNMGTGYCLPGFKAELSRKDTALWEKIEPILMNGAMKPPVVSEIASILNLEANTLSKFMIKVARLGKVCQVSKNRFLLPEFVDALANHADELGRSNSDLGFSAAEFRDKTDIGRNLSIEVLEFFDKSGFTWRTGDTRKVLKSVTEVFGDNRSDS